MILCLYQIVADDKAIEVPLLNKADRNLNCTEVTAIMDASDIDDEPITPCAGSVEGLKDFLPGHDAQQGTSELVEFFLFSRQPSCKQMGTQGREQPILPEKGSGFRNHSRRLWIQRFLGNRVQTD
jgi:hypothetical protein